MLTSLPRVEKPELLIIDSKSLRQDGITHLLEMWADVLGLTVKSGDGPLDTRCAPANCAMIIISVGNTSIKDTKHQALIKSVRGLNRMVRCPHSRRDDRRPYLRTLVNWLQS